MVSHLARHFRDRGVSPIVGCLDEIGELGKALMADGIVVELLHRRPGFDRTLPLRIARTVRRHRVEVIHAHQYTTFVYGVLAKLVTGVPMVFTEHGRTYPDQPRFKRRAFNFVFSRFAERVTAVSGGVKTALCRMEGFPPERVEVVYNGIDLGRYTVVDAPARREARRRLGIPAEAPVVGTIGRLDPIKHYTLLLAAFRRVRTDHRDARLVIVGDGPERGRLESLAGLFDLSRAVHFLGARFDVDLILPAFDVFALSSLSEGLPMTIIEAMAAGVPIVSTAVGGVPEMVRDGQEALLVPGSPSPLIGAEDLEASSRVEEFAGPLRRLLQDPALRDRLAVAARARAMGEFSLEVIGQRYRTIYEQAIGRGRAGSPG
jgi:glycosyltransferase involved in cell wall biosynthesis